MVFYRKGITRSISHKRVEEGHTNSNLYTFSMHLNSDTFMCILEYHQCMVQRPRDGGQTLCRRGRHRWNVKGGALLPPPHDQRSAIATKNDVY